MYPEVSAWRERRTPGLNQSINQSISRVKECSPSAFANLPNYLANDVDKIQKGEPMTFTSSEDALAKGMDRELKARREDACVNFVKRISPDNPIFSSIQSRIVHLSSAYSLLA